MQKLLGCLLLAAVILTGCQSKARKTSTPAAPAHNVAPAVYPGSKGENTLGASQAGQTYPGSQQSLAISPIMSGGTYPEPGTSTEDTPVIGAYAPADGDAKLTRGEAFLELQDSEVVLMETNPVQVRLHLQGSLPNPCHQLRVNPAQPDAQNRIQVEVYSVTDPDKMCTEVLQPFNVLVPLENLPKGHYSIYINGELLGEFDA
jgi:hypothetical protein